MTEEERHLQAFFRVCEKNGIPVSTVPDYNKPDPIVIGDDGKKYVLTRDLILAPYVAPTRTSGADSETNAYLSNPAT
jgi:hypothetical protein